MACIFCEIAAHRQAAEIVYEDEHVVAFRDVAPQAPIHVLIIPREHIAGPLDVVPEQEAVIGRLVGAAAVVARATGIADDGYRLVLNEGRNGGQSVFHLHMHLLGGRRLTWPPG